MSNETLAPGKSFRDWLAEGEQLYATTLKEYQTIEAQLEEMESKLVAKKNEVNQIAQVILNLINNSLDAVVHQPTRWIKVGLQQEGQQAQITVTDSGPGIRRAGRDALEPIDHVCSRVAHNGDTVRQVRTSRIGGEADVAERLVRRVCQMPLRPADQLRQRRRSARGQGQNVPWSFRRRGRTVFNASAMTRSSAVFLKRLELLPNG